MDERTVTKGTKEKRREKKKAKREKGKRCPKSAFLPMLKHRQSTTVLDTALICAHTTTPNSGAVAFCAVAVVRTKTVHLTLDKASVQSKQTLKKTTPVETDVQEKD